MKIAYIPLDLNLREILHHHPPVFEYTLDDFYYIIGTIVKLEYYASKNDNLYESEFISVSAEILKAKVPNYRRYLDYLLERKVIESDNYYIVGEKSKGYKIADLYAEFGFECVALKPLKYTRRSGNERLARTQYRYLTKWFNSNLQIDYEAAMRYLESRYKNDCYRYGANKALRIQNLRRIEVDKIKRGIFNYSVDNTSFRFHSNLTSIKSELRNFITYNKQQLCSVDIKNSQPFISTILFDKRFYSSERGRISFSSLNRVRFRDIEPFLTDIMDIIPADSIIMLVKSSVMQCSNDLELYFTLVDKGNMYEYMSQKYEDHSGVKLDVNIPEQKGELKKSMFLAMYSANSYFKHEEAKMKRFFAALFPTVYKIFCLIKEKKKSTLAVIMQTFESELILRRIAKGIAKDYPELPLFTIHDSIVTLSKHKDIVYHRMKEAFEKEMGLTPSLRPEIWGPDKL